MTIRIGLVSAFVVCGAVAFNVSQADAGVLQLANGSTYAIPGFVLNFSANVLPGATYPDGSPANVAGIYTAVNGNAVTWTVSGSGSGGLVLLEGNASMVLPTNSYTVLASSNTYTAPGFNTPLSGGTIETGGDAVAYAVRDADHGGSWTGAAVIATACSPRAIRPIAGSGMPTTRLQDGAGPRLVTIKVFR